MLQFKSKKDIKLFSMVHPILIMIIADLYNYAYEKHGVRLTITQTVTDKFIDQRLKRKSPAHSEHRAVDIRTKDLDAFVLRDILNYINEKEEYKKYHYLSLGGEKRLAYFHIGSAEHLHVALHSRYAVK
tara:strand:- start:5326 stop:5712 length:387 start_codon:yes stop_codon:yes gene_type:complete